MPETDRFSTAFLKLDQLNEGLSSGGLSGKVGNTLEGIARIMFDLAAE